MGILNQKNLWPTLIYQFEHFGTPSLRTFLLGPLEYPSLMQTIYIVELTNLFQLSFLTKQIHLLFWGEKHNRLRLDDFSGFCFQMLIFFARCSCLSTLKYTLLKDDYYSNGLTRLT